MFERKWYKMACVKKSDFEKIEDFIISKGYEYEFVETPDPRYYNVAVYCDWFEIEEISALRTN